MANSSTLSPLHGLIGARTLHADAEGPRDALSVATTKVTFNLTEGICVIR